MSCHVIGQSVHIANDVPAQFLSLNGELGGGQNQARISLPVSRIRIAAWAPVTASW